MATVDGNITVFEVSDGGSGDISKTRWQLFVDKTPVSTLNSHIADIAGLAITLKSKVRCTYDKGVISQLRLEIST